MPNTDERRAKLSPDKRLLLEKRLQGLAASAELRAAAPPLEAPAPAPDDPAALAAELALGTGAPAPVSGELWAALVEAGSQEARRLAAAPDLLADAAREPVHDRRAAAFLGSALRRLKVFQQAGEEWTIDGLIAGRGILPKYHKVLRRWLEAFVEEGLMTRHGHGYVAREPVPSPALDALLTDEQRDYYGKNLTAVLTGETHPLEFYLPGGSSQSVESSYRELPIFRYCNGISAAVLAAQTRALPAGARLRFLEVGAGTGGTTASLLPLLPAASTIFVFTDVSRFFTDLGRKKFAALPFLRYRVLDVETDPVAQGFPAASFDWVVAAHVLHATRNVEETLRHVRRLLAPGGVLLLLEETRFQRKYNFSMGFLPGFDHFEDYDRRPLHPLLSSAQWRHELLAAGFQDFVSFTEPGSAPEVMGVDVMLARLPEGA
ncbi:MAG TPA: class I SAM-dependent methyltransferase [Thermoanaerobaculia bacterium]|jgi:epothilone polyketide synthase E|nr:class I SAM-dependent methyltransferase [Thermoanaerobaculia bacterium]